MFDYKAAAAYSVQQTGTARESLLRASMSASVALWGAEMQDGAKVRDEIKAALKKAARDRGEDRKTVDRVVNAAAAMAVPLMEKVWPRLSNPNASVHDTFTECLSILALDDVRNVAALARYLGTAQPEKVKAEPGAEMASLLETMVDVGNPGGIPLGAKPEPMPEQDMSQNEAIPDPMQLDLSSLSDDQLAMLAEMVAAEMVARRKDVPLQVVNG